MKIEFRVVQDRAFDNCALQIRDYGGEQLHLITATGPVGYAERVPVFQEILKNNRSGNFFYILDNRGGHEISLSFEDMTLLNKMLFDSGIRYVRGAVVTHDRAYGILIAMAQANAEASDFKVELTSTADLRAAEDFVLEKLLATPRPA